MKEEKRGKDAKEGGRESRKEVKRYITIGARNDVRVSSWHIHQKD